MLLSLSILFSLLSIVWLDESHEREELPLLPDGAIERQVQVPQLPVVQYFVFISVSLRCSTRMTLTGWPKQQTLISHSSGGWEV